MTFVILEIIKKCIQYKSVSHAGYNTSLCVTCWIQKLGEMAEVLDVRERRQVELCADNCALTDTNLTLHRLELCPY